MPERRPEDYPPDDGQMRNDKYRIYFRGQSRHIGDLSTEELRCALLDAHVDLNIIALRLPCIEVRLEYLGQNPERMATKINDEVKNLTRCAWRHQTSRGEDEELDALEHETPV